MLGFCATPLLQWLVGLVVAEWVPLLAASIGCLWFAGLALLLVASQHMLCDPLVLSQSFELCSVCVLPRILHGFAEFRLGFPPPVLHGSPVVGCRVCGCRWQRVAHRGLKERKLAKLRWLRQTASAAPRSAIACRPQLTCSMHNSSKCVGLHWQRSFETVLHG